MEAVAAAYGWEMDCPDDTPTLRTIYQTNESDIHLLKRVVSDYGYELVIDTDENTPKIVVKAGLDEFTPDRK